MEYPQEPRFFYLRDANRRPIGAFAFVVAPADQSAVWYCTRLMQHQGVPPEDFAHGLNNLPLYSGYCVRFSVTLCAPGDQFSKEVARVRTLGRLASVFRCGLLMPRPDASGAHPPKMNLRLAIGAIRMPVREEIDFEAMDALCNRMLVRAYAEAVDRCANPVPGERPPLPVITDDDDDDDDDVPTGLLN